MRHLLGARFNAELESVYERAFTYVVGEIGHAYYALVSAPLTSESEDTNCVNCINITSISQRSKTRQSEGSRARGSRRQFPIGALQSAKARPRSLSSDAEMLAKTH